jgi:hypothetical protein
MTPRTTTAKTTPPTDPRAWGQAYLAAAMRQLELLRTLDELSKTQRDLIEAEDPEPLLAHLNQRQELIDQLDALQEQSRDWRSAFDAPTNKLPAELQLSIRNTLDAVAAAAQSIMRRDAQDQDKLQRRRKALAAELADLAGNQRATKAYVQGTSDATAVTSILQDREG